MKKQAIYKLVKFDTTYEWDETTLKKLGITKVETWYIFDSTKAVNCCEIMPSYDLLPVYCAPVNEFDMTDEQRDEFYDISALDPVSDSMYVHCSQIDPIATELPSEFVREYEYDEPANIDESWSDMLEASAIFNQAYLHLL
jgi:hypothetical protein